MSKRKTLTLDDIAAYFGISKTTVSRALSGKGRISSARKAEIISYAIDAGYPVKAAAAEPENICVVLPDNLLDNSIFFQTCLAGILDDLQKYHCNTMIELSTEDPDGLFVPDAAENVHITVSGPARFIGMDAGDMKDLSIFSAPQRRMLAGRLLAVLYAEEPGEVQVRFKTDSGLETELTLTIQKSGTPR